MKEDQLHQELIRIQRRIRDERSKEWSRPTLYDVTRCWKVRTVEKDYLSQTFSIEDTCEDIFMNTQRRISGDVVENVKLSPSGNISFGGVKIEGY